MIKNQKKNALSIRAFIDRDKRATYERQKGICPICGKHFEFEKMHADHIILWSKGSHTTPDKAFYKRKQNYRIHCS